MLEQELVNIIFRGSYAALGTSDKDNRPWVSPVVFTFNQDMELLWSSASECVHSVNLESNDNVAFCIYDSTQPQNSPQGVYISGQASQVGIDELETAVAQFYRWRYPEASLYEQKRRHADAFSGASPRRLYRAKNLVFSGISRDGHPVHGSLVDHRVGVDLQSPFGERFAGHLQQ